MSTQGKCTGLSAVMAELGGRRKQRSKGLSIKTERVGYRRFVEEGLLLINLTLLRTSSIRDLMSVIGSHFKTRGILTLQYAQTS